MADYDLKTPMPPGGRRRLDEYLRLLNKMPAAREMWDATGHKRLFIGGCLICDVPKIAGAGVFAPHPGAVPELDGRVAFYALCENHGDKAPDTDLVEARLAYLSKLP